MVLTLSDLLDDPARCVGVIEGELFGVKVDRMLRPRHGGVVFDLTFQALPELATVGYLPERCRITVTDAGKLYALPLGVPRTWKHRELSPLGAEFDYLAGDLCLFYPKDERTLRWEWDDGFEQYVTRVHRHLFFEEFHRRQGYWPVEDAPHGDPETGAHPVVSAFMRKESNRWAS